jgi:DNA helicase-2/ATP-dependent DNA helicase PcrA
MKFNSEQRIAIEHTGRNILVLAGAGTGKTRTIVGRAAYLIEHGQNANRVLMLTFTRRAAREMVDRLEKSIGPTAAHVSAGTFHHFCLSALRWKPGAFGLTNPIVIDRDDQIQLFKLARGQQNIEGTQFPKAKTLVDIYSYARNTNQPARTYLEKFTEYDSQTQELILKIFTSYTRSKQSNNYLDFDDILFRFAKSLHQNPKIRQQLQSRFDHILVDEMQDTNPLQWLALDGLRDPAHLFCVGDDAQSIYAFRGADFKNVHSFAQRIQDSTVLHLEENYRSTQEILDLPNWLLKQSPLNFDKNLHANRGLGIKPRIIDFDDDFSEGRWIADDMIGRHENGAAWAEHLILTRTSYAARAVEAAMIAKKIPYKLHGGTPLLQAAHVKDLFSLIRCGMSHRDELAWIRYLTLWPKIGDVTAARIVEKIKSRSTLREALATAESELENSADILDRIRKIAQNTEHPAIAICEASRSLEDVLSRKYEKWETRRKDFDLIIRLAERYKSFASFLDTYVLDPIYEKELLPLIPVDEVILSTIHSAKGTEAPVCYVIRAEPGMYPYNRALGNFDQEEEERRVLYVAMTRAQDELILTRTLERNDLTVLSTSAMVHCSEKGVNYFLENLPEHLVESELFQSMTNISDDFDIFDDVIIPAERLPE